MSKFNKSKDHKSDGAKDSRPKNLGPAGFPMFEYYGASKDHSHAWLKLKRNLKNSILQYKLDILLEQIIDDGVDPEVPELDLHALMKLAPTKMIKPAAARLESQESDSDESEDNKSYDSDDVNDEDQSLNLQALLSRATQDKEPLVAKSETKPLKSSSEFTENPLYEIQVSLFNEDLKTQSKARMNQVLQLKKDKHIFYVIMWSQCGLSMQNHIQSIKSFAKKHKSKNALWLYKALEAAGCGAVALKGTTATASTLVLFVGMSMSQFETIHTYWERWKLANAASIAAGNPKMSVSVLIELFNKSLHDGYAPFKADIENRKLTKGAMPTSLDDNFWQACNFVSVPTVVSTEARAVYLTADQQALLGRRKQKPNKPKPPDVKSAEIIAAVQKRPSKSKDKKLIPSG